jgi:hypothetical protein
LEINCGFVVWNNAALAATGFSEEARRVFNLCEGCFESTQDWLTFAAAAYQLPLSELDECYNFSFARDLSMRENVALRNAVGSCRFDGLYIVHFLNPKPWNYITDEQADPANTLLLQAWRRFAATTGVALQPRPHSPGGVYSLKRAVTLLSLSCRRALRRK